MNDRLHQTDAPQLSTPNVEAEAQAAPAIVVTVENYTPPVKHTSRRALQHLLPSTGFARIVLCSALIIGGFMRLYGLNWDQNSQYHPDERWITMVTSSMKLPSSVREFLDPQQSPLNPYYDAATKRPRNFAYGTLSIYLTKIVAWTLGQFNKEWMSYDYIPLIGRAISGLLDTGAIFLVFLLGRRLFSEWVGAQGALLYGLTVLSIQHSHFYTTDVTLNFFILLNILFATEIIRDGRAHYGFLSGAAAGMALASKFSAAPILAVITVALTLRWLGWSLRIDEPQSLLRTPLLQLARVLAASVAGFLVFHFLFQPYAYLDFPGLVASVTEQNGIIVTGEGQVPYTRQYIGTTPYLYFIEQILRWAMGWPLGLAGFAGWGLLIWLAIKRRSASAILLLTWMIPYFLITGRFHAKFLRYALPLLPFLALAAALFLNQLRGSSSLMRPGTASSPLRYLPNVLTGVVTICALFWALAFCSIYTKPHTANQAAAWINNNVPKGAALLKEHWEEGLNGLKPIYKLPPQVPELPMYDADDVAKLQTIKRLLTTGDYMVFYSNRLYGTVPRLPERYPMSRRYYELLLSGKLGYDLVHFSEAYPHFAGVAFLEDTFSRPELPIPAPLAQYKPAPLTINAGFADESFTAYDHPLVMVFKKVRPITDTEIDAALRPFLISKR